MDTLTPAGRSERMSRVRSKDTKPEMIVRSLVHRMGYRYRLHDRSLPGNPDWVFPSRGKIIFVHGCLWHRHGKRCEFTRWPKSRLDFWRPKND
jgi:DNA mismatch endonuclease (patch repair protein)